MSSHIYSPFLPILLCLNISKHSFCLKLDESTTVEIFTAISFNFAQDFILCCFHYACENCDETVKLSYFPWHSLCFCEIFDGSQRNCFWLWKIYNFLMNQILYFSFKNIYKHKKNIKLLRNGNLWTKWNHEFFDTNSILFLIHLHINYFIMLLSILFNHSLNTIFTDFSWWNCSPLQNKGSKKCTQNALEFLVLFFCIWI